VPIVALKDIVDRAFAERYGVAAINVVNDLTLEAVLAAAVQERSPLIVQTSVKTVRSIGIDLLFAMWRELTADVDVPVSLHLDHCPDRGVISDCLRKGWNSVLFDASALPVEENRRQTIEVVAEARSYGASVEGEIESITGVEDGIGSDDESARQSLPVALDFIRATGVDVFAPASCSTRRRACCTSSTTTPATGWRSRWARRWPRPTALRSAR
jgi:fructose/tagatose bisphosphate aldolase